MSVLKNKRSESKAEFVNTANRIYVETINFLSRLSARYSRLLAEPIAKLASDVVSNAEAANNIYPKDEITLKLRTEHMLEARAALSALDVEMALCYEVMLTNPQGCFTTPSGKSLPPEEASYKLEKMSQSLGELIDTEVKLLTSVMKSDKGLFAKKGV